MAQQGKNCLPMQETWVQSLGQDDPLEVSMATYNSILALEIPWTEEPGGLQSLGLKSVGHDLMTEQQRSRPHWALQLVKLPPEIALDNVLTKVRTRGRAGDEVGREGQVTSALKVSKGDIKDCGMGGHFLLHQRPGRKKNYILQVKAWGLQKTRKFLSHPPRESFICCSHRDNLAKSQTWAL